MAYTKQTWQDSPNTTTPITAARLSHIEDGIEANSNAIEALGGGVAMFVVREWLVWDYDLHDDRISFVLDEGVSVRAIHDALQDGKLPVLHHIDESMAMSYGYDPEYIAHFKKIESWSASFTRGSTTYTLTDIYDMFSEYVRTDITVTTA